MASADITKIFKDVDLAVNSAVSPDNDKYVPPTSREGYNRAYDIPEEVLRNYKDPNWRAKQRAIRRAEGDSVDESDEDGVMSDIFSTNNPLFKNIDKLEQLKEVQTNGIHNFIPVKSEYQRLIDGSIGGKVGMRFGIKEALGFQKSMELYKDKNVLANAERIKFIQWLIGTERVDPNKLDDRATEAFLRKWRSVRRLRIDTLLVQLLRQIENIFIKTIIENPNIPDADKYTYMHSASARENLMKEMVKNGDLKITYDNCNMIEWFFHKYGIDDAKDVEFFKVGAVCSFGNYNESMVSMFNRFKEVTGVDFPEVYAYYHNEYSKWLNGVNSIDDSDDNDTEDITDKVKVEHNYKDKVMTTYIPNMEDDDAEEIFFDD